jgi:hypothetical protein
MTNIVLLSLTLSTNNSGLCTYSNDGRYIHWYTTQAVYQKAELGACYTYWGQTTNLIERTSFFAHRFICSTTYIGSLITWKTNLIKYEKRKLTKKEKKAFKKHNSIKTNVGWKWYFEKDKL